MARGTYAESIIATDTSSTVDDVLTLANFGRPVEIVRPRRHVLRMCVEAPSGAPTAADLRVLVVADVVRRVAELHDVQVLAAFAARDGGSSGHTGDTGDILTTDRADVGRSMLLQAADRLAISPPMLWVHAAHEAPAALLGSLDLQVNGEAAASRESSARVCLTVAGVRAGAPVPAIEDFDEPLAMRLWLIGRRYSEVLQPQPRTMTEPQETLTRWRSRVAEWAASPSQPMAAHAVRKAYECFDDDLDTGSAVAVLLDLEADTAVAAGSKFETFVHLDRVFGLDLARQVGQPQR